jgi:hypothetical protein
MARRLATVLFAASLLGGLPGAVLLDTSPASAQVACAPYCDFVHDYGPYDLSWQQPGLTCYPRCNARGDCAPTSTCVVVTGVAGRSAFMTGPLGRRQVGRVTVRSLQRPR